MLKKGQVSWAIVIFTSSLSELGVYCKPSCFFRCAILCLEIEEVEEQSITFLLVTSFSIGSTTSKQNNFSPAWQSASI